MTRSGSSARRSCRTFDDRSRAPGRRRAGGGLDPELHRLRGGDGGLVWPASARSSASPSSGSRSRTGRANVLATRAGTGGGPTLMFNGHMDTSYSGREPWLAGIPGFQPEGFERDGPDLRARDLEHEGRARRLSRGRAGARRRAAEGRRACSPPSPARSRRRSRATRRERSSAATRRGRATSSGTAARPTCASSASRPSRSSCSRTSGRSGCGSRRPVRSSTRPSRPAGSRRTRSCGCATCSTGCSRGCRSGRRR